MARCKEILEQMRDSGDEMRKDLRADIGFEVRRSLRISERKEIIKNALIQTRTSAFKISNL